MVTNKNKLPTSIKTSNKANSFITIIISVLFLLTFQATTAHSFLSLSGSDSKEYKKIKINRIERSIGLIKRYYYDPSRIQALNMFEDGLNRLSIKIPEMTAYLSPDHKTLKLSLLEKTKNVSLSEINDLEDIIKPLKSTFHFIEKNYEGDIKKEDQEYAFIAGMLEPLDPHSNILPPEVFKEFKTQTQGEYGGIGIVVGIKDDELTIISPIEGTPGMRAGLKAEDKITQIDDVPTINMPLNEAVKLLRGKVNSKVILSIDRKNKDPFEVEITREQITIESVKHKLVKKGAKHIGIISIRSFQEDTYRDMNQALNQMSETESLDGLVLDFRNNPGGLLDQSLQMADKFIAEGDLLYTVGANNQDEHVNRASQRDDLLSTPIIVLVNQGTASASEIVAGALRNNNRAIILGTQTFGKGSVQSLFDLRDGSSLKLTIAQYLTPGRVSIQAVGVTPDIELQPITITEEAFDLVLDENFGEKNLDEHLENSKYAKKMDPVFKLQYFEEEKLESESEYTSKIQEDKDYPLSLAIKILSKSNSAKREKLLETAVELLEKEEKKQEELIVAELKKFQINWQDLPDQSDDKKVNFILQSKFKDKETKKALSSFEAGKDIIWEVEIQNKSDKNIPRLIGIIDSENALVKEREFVFGTIKPQEKKSAQVILKVPNSLIPFKENVSINFQSASKNIAQEKIALQFKEKAKPVFSYSYEILDRNNKNGLPEKGEVIDLKFQVTNLGPSLAEEVFINLKNVEEEGITLKKGRLSLDSIKVGDTKTALLSFEIGKDFPGNEMDIDFSILDKKSASGLVDELHFPVSSKEIPFNPQVKKVQKLPTIDLKLQKVVQEEIELSGIVQDDQELKDLMIFIGGRKLYYQAIKSSETNKKEMSFKTKLPLEEGLNVVLIQARDNRELTQTKSFAVIIPKKEEAQTVSK